MSETMKIDSFWQRRRRRAAASDAASARYASADATADARNYVLSVSAEICVQVKSAIRKAGAK